MIADANVPFSDPERGKWATTIEMADGSFFLFVDVYNIYFAAFIVSCYYIEDTKF